MGRYPRLAHLCIKIVIDAVYSCRSQNYAIDVIIRSSLEIDDYTYRIWRVGVKS